MNEARMNRRSFLDWVLRGGMVIWAAGFIAPVLNYVWPAQSRGPATESVSAGKADDIGEGQAKIVALNGSPVIVVRTPQGFKALSAICTHLGCIVAWDAGRRQIACPCHAGLFDLNGRPVAGPPPRPLPEMKVAVIDGDVKVMSA